MTTYHPPTKLDYEALLKQKGCSYALGNGWAIAWQDEKWRVFWRGMDAHYRLCVATKIEAACLYHETFLEAWNWVQGLTQDDVRYITVDSR